MLRFFVLMRDKCVRSSRMTLTTLRGRPAPGFATETARLRGHFCILVYSAGDVVRTLLGVLVREAGWAVAVSVG